ncbi:hypothetical protein ACFX13_027909 [Malus domestica]
MGVGGENEGALSMGEAELGLKRGGKGSDSKNELGVENMVAGGCVEEGKSGRQGRGVVEAGDEVVGEGKRCGLGRGLGSGSQVVESLGL